MIGHKTSLNKFKKSEIISSIFSYHKGLRLKTNLKGNTQKHSNSWRLNSMLLNNEWVKNEIREGIKKFFQTNENELTTIQKINESRSRFFEKINKIHKPLSRLIKEKREDPNKQPNTTPTSTWK